MWKILNLPTRYVEYRPYLDNYSTFFMYEISQKTIEIWLTLAEKYIKLSQYNIDNNF